MLTPTCTKIRSGADECYKNLGNTILALAEE